MTDECAIHPTQAEMHEDEPASEPQHNNEYCTERTDVFELALDLDSAFLLYAH